MIGRMMLRWVAPGAVALLLALTGNYLRAAAHVALFVAALLLPWIAWQVLIIPARLVRRRPAAAPALGLIFSLAAMVAIAQVVFGIPRWTVRDAQPAIVALESWKSQHGSYPQGEPGGVSFPLELWRELRGASCPVLESAGSSYRLICDGLWFTHCVYDSKTRVWTSFD
jgi:hypothetical protein